MGGTSNQMNLTNALLLPFNPGGSNRQENLAPNFVLSTVNCKLAFQRQERPASEGGPYTNCELSTANYKRAFLRPAFTTTSINIVGAPTFWFLRAGKGSPKNRSEDRPLHRRECGPPPRPGRGKRQAAPFNLQLSTLNRLAAPSLFSPLATRHSPLSLIIPVHPRGSPVSPIIPVHTQKQGGGGT
jgi:hypothetical protein